MQLSFLNKGEYPKQVMFNKVSGQQQRDTFNFFYIYRFRGSIRIRTPSFNIVSPRTANPIFSPQPTRSK